MAPVNIKVTQYEYVKLSSDIETTPDVKSSCLPAFVNRIQGCAMHPGFVRIPPCSTPSEASSPSLMIGFVLANRRWFEGHSPSLILHLVVPIALPAYMINNL